MKTTKIELWIQWDPAKHRDPAEWDLAELIDPEGEHKLKTRAQRLGSCDSCGRSMIGLSASPLCPHCARWEMT